MALPTRSDVLTLDYSGGAQPAAYVEAKALSPSSATLDYTLAAQPVFGLAPSGGGVSVSITGVEATGAVGTVSISALGNVSLTGVEATGAVGTVTVSAGGISVPVTGVEATGAVGTVNLSGKATISLLG
jgi:hypothetical protein